MRLDVLSHGYHGSENLLARRNNFLRGKEKSELAGVSQLNAVRVLHATHAVGVVCGGARGGVDGCGNGSVFVGHAVDRLDGVSGGLGEGVLATQQITVNSISEQIFHFQHFNESNTITTNTSSSAVDLTWSA